jgi:hypothetical protein
LPSRRKAKEGHIVRVRKQTAITRPVARTEGLLVETVGEETVVYDLDTKEAHCLKSLAASVFMYADGDRTASDIAELAAYRMGTPVTEADVTDAVKQLESCALLEAGPLVIRDGVTRRTVMSRGMKIAGVATATPLIASVMAPVASATQSLIKTGECCGHTPDNCTGGNPLCESGHCCQNLSSKDCNQCKCVGDKNDCSTDQCANAAGTCPAQVINGISTAACGQTSSGKCCYPDANNNCCTVFFTPGSTVLNC